MICDGKRGSDMSEQVAAMRTCTAAALTPAPSLLPWRAPQIAEEDIRPHASLCS